MSRVRVGFGGNERAGDLALPGPLPLLLERIAVAEQRQSAWRRAAGTKYKVVPPSLTFICPLGRSLSHYPEAVMMCSSLH